MALITVPAFLHLLLPTGAHGLRTLADEANIHGIIDIIAAIKVRRTGGLRLKQVPQRRHRPVMQIGSPHPEAVEWRRTIAKILHHVWPGDAELLYGLVRLVCG